MCPADEQTETPLLLDGQKDNCVQCNLPNALSTTDNYIK